MSVAEGNGDAIRAFLTRLGSDAFYTYLLLDPRGLPFYVGKGKGLRVLHHQLEALRDSGIWKSNPFKCNKIRAIVAAGHSLRYRIDQVFAPEDEMACLEREEELIRLYRRRSDGGILTNLAAGLGSLSARDPFSQARHTATLSGTDETRPERTALNLYLQSLGGVDSVPIKPLSEYRNRLVSAYPSPKNLITPSRRNALTIVAAALASGVALRPDAVVPRVFTYWPDPDDWPLPGPPPQSVAAVIENGAMCDVLKLGLARLRPAPSPEGEGLILDAHQIGRVTDLIGRDEMQEWGLLDNR